jgi:basic amino acid/polyamine antiporter, APA family
MAELVNRSLKAATNPVAQSLPRRFGLWTSIALVMGSIIGSGIFRVPATVAADSGSAAAIGLLWLLGGIITLCLALSLSELATMFPRAGGVYLYIREAYGPKAAFVYGWTFLLIDPAGWASVALIFTEYLGQLFPMTGTVRHVLPVALIAVLTVANYVSAALGASIQTLATAAKIFAIIGVTVVIFAHGSGSSGALLAHSNIASETTLSGLSAAMVSVLYAYEGAACFCSVAGEVRSPARTLPRALVVGVAAVVALYVLINTAFLYILPLDVLSHSPLVAADAMVRVMGPVASSIAAALVMVSSFGALTALSISDPRVLCAMAQDDLFFKQVGRIHRRFETPHIAILLMGLLGALYASLRSFEELSAAFILGLWPFYALAVGGVLVLRAKRPELERPYRALGHPFVPLFFIGATALVVLTAFLDQPIITLLNVAVTLSGVPAYFVWRWFAGERSRASAERIAEQILVQHSEERQHG